MKYLNLHELYQLITVLLYSAASIDSETKEYLLELCLDSKENATRRNTCFYELVKDISAIKTGIQDLFCDKTTNGTKITEFFTFIQPKTYFIIQPNKNRLKSTPKNAARMDLKVILQKELPEASLLQSMHETNNTYELLSATGMFQDQKLGNSQMFSMNTSKK